MLMHKVFHLVVQHLFIPTDDYWHSIERLRDKVLEAALSSPILSQSRTRLSGTIVLLKEQLVY